MVSLPPGCGCHNSELGRSSNMGMYKDRTHAGGRRRARVDGSGQRGKPRPLAQPRIEGEGEGLGSGGRDDIGRPALVLRH